MKLKKINILLHPIEKKETIRIDFKTELIETDIYEKLKLLGYEIYQYIQDDFKYNMEPPELDAKNIKYYKLYREKKSWFGLSKKNVIDLLIKPENGFYYPYQYGNYFYLFTKHKVSPSEFEKWINDLFPNKFADFDETFSTGFKKGFKLLNIDDYILITNHDYQRDFGILANEFIIDKLLGVLNEAHIIKEQRFKRK